MPPQHLYEDVRMPYSIHARLMGSLGSLSNIVLKLSTRRKRSRATAEESDNVCNESLKIPTGYAALLTVHPC